MTPCSCIWTLRLDSMSFEAKKTVSHTKVTNDDDDSLVALLVHSNGRLMNTEERIEKLLFLIRTNKQHTAKL